MYDEYPGPGHYPHRPKTLSTLGGKFGNADRWRDMTVFSGQTAYERSPGPIYPISVPTFSPAGVRFAPPIRATKLRPATTQTSGIFIAHQRPPLMLPPGPGPGCHHPSHDSIESPSHSYRFGASGRSRVASSDCSPGPGKYAPAIMNYSGKGGRTLFARARPRYPIQLEKSLSESFQKERQYYSLPDIHAYASSVS
eukprot:TRINITY_DN17593_c0_g1::TRINITY_DN17593_c0_g1_i1::g.18887::m.18887 TRINITY_DN17593_c0_g1::TRINITY_DN17593_c0_g1_i1::g.18887  ORF type:complete len:196 (-),score=-10.99,SHIPPO-rpt/PF07004.7/44,SHIPPO-rpt/PF07004.7/1.3e+04,SHIPPO-rpt/PF07004.7/8.5,SHIPPO-rpt/PF07004.7/5.3 TRINITY_DN17593_c0_g1_i1:48-635(-)